MTPRKSHPLQVGDRIHHWRMHTFAPPPSCALGTILETRPQTDGSTEYLVQRDAPLLDGGSNDPTWWPSYHTEAWS